MNDLVKRLATKNIAISRYQAKRDRADMTSHYFNGIMIGVSLCFFVSPDNQRGEWILFLLATMGFATCIWLSSRWQHKAEGLADEAIGIINELMESGKKNNAESN